MKTTCSTLILFVLTLFVMSCQKQTTTLTAVQKSQIEDSTKEVLQKILENCDKLDFNTAFQFHSENSDARYIENGAIFPSLDQMKEAYNQLEASLELVENTVDSWDILVLAKDVVSFTLPIHIRFKVKDLPEYKGQYVWSGILQKQNGAWMMVQTHESYLNHAEFIAALTPPPAN